MNTIDPIILKILENRGIKTQEDILEFLSLNPKRTYDPFLMTNMEEGVSLLEKHIKKDSLICIYGDYDADGITSVTMLYEALQSAKANVFYYIPSRMEEGYGLNKEAIETIVSRGAGLIITVDCGSVSYDEVEYAKKLGIDIIVTDHHTITDKKAECILINPKQPGCRYPFKSLAGVGVTFKLVQALNRRGLINKAVLSEVLDLAAIGTIGDIMPLVDENRTIVKFGLKELNRGKRTGIKILLGKAGLKEGTVSSENVAYILVPHLNASGRMADAAKAVELLLSKDKAESAGLSEELIICNNNRKKIQEETYKRAISMLQLQEAQEKENREKNIIVLPIGDAHEGIIGIVAGKIKDKFNKPTLILTTSGSQGEFYKGTGRSIEGLDLYRLLKNSEGLFEKFGGHAGACGFLIKKENYPNFKACVEEAMEKLVMENKDLFCQTCKSEMCLTLADINDRLVESLEHLSPFGAGNPKPLFEFTGILPKEVTYLGNQGLHVRFSAVEREKELGCILFGKAQEYRRLLSCGGEIKIIASAEFNYWNNTRKIQLTVESMGEI